MMLTDQTTTFPTLREYVDAGLAHPAVDEVVFHPLLAEVIVNQPSRRGAPVHSVLAELLEERRATASDQASDEGRLVGWLAELVEGEVTVDEVLGVLPATVAELVVAESRPWVLEVERRDVWICTATGREGSGPVAVIRPRMGDAAGDLKGYEAVVSLEALREAVEVIEELNADDLG